MYLLRTFFDKFNELNEIEKELIIENSYIADYEKNDLLFKTQAPVTQFLYLLKGLVKLEQERRERKIIFNLISQNNFVSLVSNFGDTKYSFTGRCATKCKILHIDKDVLLSIINGNKNFLSHLLKLMAEESLQTIRNLIIMKQKQMPGRVADVLLFFYRLYEKKSFELPIERKELAQFAGASLEAFTRTLMELKNDRIIFIEDVNKIHINSLDLLEKLSKYG